MRLCSILIAAGLVASCAANRVTDVGQSLVYPAPITANTTADEKAWYLVEAAYNVPAQAYVAAVKAKKLSPQVRAVIKPKLQYMNKVRIAARAAYRVGDSAGLLTRLNELQSLRDAVAPLIPSL